jgi:murein DD-endopeptidase MepM/ murein hydrolase activator NlpD
MAQGKERVKRNLGAIFIFVLLLSSIHSSRRTDGEARAQARPFGLPFADPPGPDTWLLIQPYGNTTGAFRQRKSTYQAGQGIHFGVDLSAPCGYPLIAIGQGVVAKVDELRHGSAPHNLMINHPNGYASFYGHLLEKPDLVVGQTVAQGDPVARVGDPEGYCAGWLAKGDLTAAQAGVRVPTRPHLHLEIRNTDGYNRAYNPILVIEADWDTLALTGAAGLGFARDLDDPRRWQFLDDQPETAFWGPLLNDYAHPWPLEWR